MIKIKIIIIKSKEDTQVDGTTVVSIQGGGWREGGGGGRLFFSLSLSLSLSLPLSLSPSLPLSFSLRAHAIFITKDRTDKPVFEDGTEEAKKNKKSSAENTKESVL